MSEYPTSCPEGALEVTAPITRVTADLSEGPDGKPAPTIFTVFFGEGEQITFTSQEALNVNTYFGWMFLPNVVDYLSENGLVWADPATMARELGDEVEV